MILTLKVEVPDEMDCRKCRSRATLVGEEGTALCQAFGITIYQDMPCRWCKGARLIELARLAEAKSK